MTIGSLCERGEVNRMLKRRALTVAGMVSAIFATVYMTAANAAVDSSTTTAVTGIFTDTKTLIVGVLATGFFLVLLAVIAIRLGGKWGKKAANQ